MHWWRYFSPLLALVTLAALLSSGLAPSAGRSWRLVATALELAVVTATFAYFVPSILAMLVRHGDGLSPAELAAKASTWAALNWVRVVLTLAAWLAGLRALSRTG